MSKKIEYVFVVGLQNAAGDNFSIRRNKTYSLEKNLAITLISGGIVREIDEQSIDLSSKDAKIDELTQENLMLKAKLENDPASGGDDEKIKELESKIEELSEKIDTDSEVKISELSQTVLDMEKNLKDLEAEKISLSEAIAEKDEEIKNLKKELAKKSKSEK